MNTALMGAFLLGLASSGHCLGMCGPIALAIPVKGGHWVHGLRSALWLNTGRLLTYGLLGAAFGAFGRGLALAGAQRSVSIALGLLLLLIVVLPGVFKGLGPFGRIGVWLSHTQALLARNLRRTSALGLFSSGMLNGLLPCGMVYLAIAGAVIQDNWTTGAAFMMVFGLGTWPALVTLRLLGGQLSGGWRVKLRPLTPVVYGVMGVLLVLRGLDLGIPYISPVLPDVPMAVQACDPDVVPR